MSFSMWALLPRLFEPERIDRLQPVSRIRAGSRGLGRERAGSDGCSKQLSRLRNSEIRVSDQPVSRFSHLRIRFPCATATFLISLVLASRARASPNCLQEYWRRKARGEPIVAWCERHNPRSRKCAHHEPASFIAAATMGFAQSGVLCRSPALMIRPASKWRTSFGVGAIPLLGSASSLLS
jgi:hypothetical protein